MKEYRTLYVGKDVEDHDVALPAGIRTAIFISDLETMDGPEKYEVITVQSKEMTSKMLFEKAARICERLGFRLSHKRIGPDGTVEAVWINEPRITD